MTPSRTIKLTIEYDGTQYHGWQIQPEIPTVQGAIETALGRITGQEIRIVGAGRTDAGVHAEGQVAHFHADTSMSCQVLRNALNALLPPDIVILDVVEAASSFHARYDAVSRVYRYTILNRDWSSAFVHAHVLHRRGPLDVDRLDAMSSVLVGTHDFSSFRKTGSDRENPTCTVQITRWWREETVVRFEIVANSFLRGMVRAIVGTCLKWQKEQDAPARMRTVLESKDRAAAGPSAPAHGLCLREVRY